MNGEISAAQVELPLAAYTWQLPGELGNELRLWQRGREPFFCSTGGWQATMSGRLPVESVEKGKKMRMRASWIALLMIPVLMGSVAFTGAGATPPNQKGVDQSFTYVLDEDAAPGSQVPSLGEAVYTDMAMHGTLWTPEVRTNFSVFRPYGWGTATRPKAASRQWVHMPLPYATVINGVPQRIQYVEFCAQSSNGTVTGPLRMDLWAHNVRFLQEHFAWPFTNNIACHGHLFATPIWKQDLGISVWLGFPNTTDTITLYKAWVRTVP